MAAADISMAGVHGFLSTHQGRDAVGQFVDFSARAVTGFLAEIIPRLDASYDKARWQEAATNAKKLMMEVGGARRTVRWLSSLGIVLALRKLYSEGACPWYRARWAFATAQLSLLVYHVCDHWRWLVATGLVAGDVTRIKNVSFTGQALAAAVSALYFAHTLVTPPPMLLENPEKEAENQRGLAKNALTLVCALHLGELATSHEAVVGVAGAGAALITIYETFPTKKAV